jgi:hypothetical protein
VNDPVIWVRVERPTFDLVGVLLSSLGITGICAGIALGLGALFGTYLILRGRRRPAGLALRLELHAEASSA